MGEQAKAFAKSLFVGGLHSPAAAALLTFLLAGIGVTGSVYSETLASHWPLERSAWGTMPNETWSWTAFWFWNALSATALLFLLRQRAVDMKRAGVDGGLENAVGDVKASAELLHRAIRTMPPGTFLEVFDSVYQKCEAVAWAATVEDRTRENLVIAVRTVLHGFIRLVQVYDQPWAANADRDGGAGGDSPRYAANVMVYVPREHFRDGDDAVLRGTDGGGGRLRFWDASYRGDLRGVLDLRTDLSAASDSEDVDTELAKFCVPIPNDPNSRRSDGTTPWRVLPGAPMAFVTRQPTHFRDTRQLAKWCEEHGEFRGPVLIELDEYFTSGAGQHVRSLAAHPLARAAHGKGPQNPDAAPPIGVLKIHSDAPGLRGGDENLSFYGTTYPLQDLLLKLLENLIELADVGEHGQWMLSARDAATEVAPPTPAVPADRPVPTGEKEGGPA